MNFESFLQSETLRPLSAVYSRALLDCSETASVIARLPPPKIALIYHAALMRTTAIAEDGAQPLTAEHLSARIVSAYGLTNTDRQQADSATTKRQPHTSAESARDAAAARQFLPTLFPPLPPPPLCCRDAHGGDAFRHLERVTAQREAALQQSVVESLMRMRAATSNRARALLPET
ncbi:hypothetical protein ABB37_04946 [Leptomonas pyrrhocoris]|uniref:Uncharacterized protein n=1 Tax=Leptomonas pyrrhocoris TaxID=157538 RepID=A0A0M9G0R2_LEPPY|nr:hypothetical protein ABB37_04946 [Leptomonas pyrrhocoris]XP_015658311.1 hypothetical protein ABB37_04946 [Leptomonas pyrrhocoris]XP_015658312.1 hypothetical protein ABB37_04946 [Leptomonas pyrrhocoris]KPA79871.1 hypothetical protein ABB37_04946 [Leptomonas pyrrhocoris]KPA79872.1 hypothetical protein ABB37_04946 [Leptomonas pyrrhocoris]KPA79873.1 hypothetical protein ABB37_04946 [Leptomonas pyrrhocoris]|eukprot:XP_015658310.1 hypothetical protein ABB37_04946 [Leptomonas pyrrhocoris]